MTANVHAPQPPSNVPAGPSATNATTAGAVASVHAPGEVTSKTTINSLADLKRKAPEVYQKMLEGIGMSICNRMKDHQDRLKRLMRESNS